MRLLKREQTDQVIREHDTVHVGVIPSSLCAPPQTPKTIPVQQQVPGHSPHSVIY